MSNEIKRFHSILDIVLSDLQYVPSDPGPGGIEYWSRVTMLQDWIVENTTQIQNIKRYAPLFFRNHN